MSQDYIRKKNDDTEATQSGDTEGGEQAGSNLVHYLGLKGEMSMTLMFAGISSFPNTIETN